MDVSSWRPQESVLEYDVGRNPPSTEVFYLLWTGRASCTSRREAPGCLQKASPAFCARDGQRLPGGIGLRGVGCRRRPGDKMRPDVVGEMMIAMILQLEDTLWVDPLIAPLADARDAG